MLLATCSAVTIAPVGAQVRGAYLPLDHPSHPVAERLFTRGLLRGLDAQNRPFLLRDLRASVARALESGRGNQADLEALRWLADVIGRERDLTGEPGSWVLSFAPEVGVLGATSDVPELLLSDGDSALHSLVRLRAGGELGPISVQVEPRRVHNGRAFFGSALVRASWSLAGFEWGDLERNWGPAGTSGLLISPFGRTRPEMSFYLGPQVLRFEYRTAPLSNGVDTDTGESAARMWAMHRLRWRPSERLELAVWETALSAEPGGPDAARSSPFRPFWFPFQQGRNEERNSIVGLDGSWNLAPGTLLEGQLFVDDYYRDDNAWPYPHRFGYTLQMRGRLGRASAWRVYGTVFSGWALMTLREEEYYVDNGRGMGRLRPDHRAAGAFVTLPWGFRAPVTDTREGWPGTGTAELGVRWRKQGVAAFTDAVLRLDPDLPERHPNFSPEIEREVWALVTDLSWTVGPLALRTENHLQYRRFPSAAGDWEWAVESTVELVWRVGRWSWSGVE